MLREPAFRARLLIAIHIPFSNFQLALAHPSVCFTAIFTDMDMSPGSVYNLQ